MADSPNTPTLPSLSRRSFARRAAFALPVVAASGVSIARAAAEQPDAALRALQLRWCDLHRRADEAGGRIDELYPIAEAEFPSEADLPKYVLARALHTGKVWVMSRSEVEQLYVVPKSIHGEKRLSLLSSVPRPSRHDHDVEDGEEFAGAGRDGELPGFALGDETLEERPDLGIVLGSDRCADEESRAHWRPAAADEALPAPFARLAGEGCKTDEGSDLLAVEAAELGGARR